MAVKLSDYALIGNSRAAALVSNNGSVDWCCLPEFDSPSIFAAILSPGEGGHFSINPASEFSSAQNYIADTNVVETLFEASGGGARLTDAFTAQEEAAKHANLFPDHELLRVLEGVSGRVCFKMELVPRTYYGKRRPALKDQKKLGIHLYWRGDIYIFQTTLRPDQLAIHIEDAKVMAQFEVMEGQQVVFSLSYSNQSPAILPELEKTGWERMQQTIRYWKKWVGNCRYTGIYEEQVKRSALTLKLLSHAPSGAIIAAPTTSLPEQPGGARNWDYRYCWLRDASFTTRVLVKLGFEEEAHAYMNWILHATRLTRPRLQVVYSVFGHASLKEKTLDWLSGYMGSRPVRIGNGADGQFQLDVYGEVLDAFFSYAHLVKSFDRDTRKFIVGIGESICKLWDRPDNGIWEIRSACSHHTHSKVMAGVGLDRLIRLSEKFHWENVPLEKYRRIAAAIRQEVDSKGYNQSLQSYTRTFGGEDLDASLLTLPLVGYCAPSSPKMISTMHMIQRQLSKNGLIYRYRAIEDGLEGSEGTFGICGFWLAENLAKAGELKKATQLFERMLQCAGPSGLLSEELDPDTYELLGNYPQGFTHIGLINAALTIQEEITKSKPVSNEYR